MKKGDLLLINYTYDPVGWLIQLTTHSQWNHVGWALNEFCFVHSTGKGIRTSSLAEYQNNPFYRLKLVRLKDLTKKQIKEITKLLVAQRCKVPYWKFFVSYFLVALHKKGLVQNCSNFIFNAMKKVGYNPIKSNKHYVVPEDFNKLSNKDVTDELPAGTPHGIFRELYGKICGYCTSL